MKQKNVTWKMVVRVAWKDFIDNVLPVFGILMMLVIAVLIGVAAMCGYFAYLYEPLELWFVHVGVLTWPGMLKGLVGATTTFFLPIGAYVGFTCLSVHLFVLGADVVDKFWSRHKRPPIIPSCLSA